MDILIGAEIFFSLLSVGQIKLNAELITLQKTQLGWIVSGKCKAKPNITRAICDLAVANAEDFVMEDENVDKTLQKFWEIEEVKGCESKCTPEHMNCENHFKENFKILPSGRFEVKLPFKKDPSALGSTFEIAQKRFLSLERRLQKTPEAYDMYKDFMNEYITLGHMSPIENIDFNMPHYFIPHQCVLRPDAATTKLRVVFDASC
ncbi:PREDICTED: uncharacterized protein LOC108370024 [Rhagoletis zephyria]|uniref:uncharacterized protein LOC108370024 n=1 Tax=Rhagoletis zephyria TaxID=28612 RepID=UPI0008117F48|nr:PREDICTED: uncharacterized protein LOC108370024 [Rhagoletis zephyria]